MFKRPTDIESILLAVLESILATQICDRRDQKSIDAYFDQFDESTFTLIENEIKDQYEKEQLYDFITHNTLLPNHQYSFISDKAKSDFINKFKREHPDLKYIGIEKITACIEQYIEKINVLLNNCLSTDGKIILQHMNVSEMSITATIQNNTQEIITAIKDTVSPITETKEMSTPVLYHIGIKNKLFYGRTQKIDEILSKIKSNNVVFLAGLGGIGKSQIAREIVFRLKKKYGLIMWFSANTEIELMNDFNDAAISFELIDTRKNDFDHVVSKLSLFIRKHSNSLIIYDGADNISIDLLAEKCFFTDSDIIVTTQNSNIDIDEFSVVPIDLFTPEEAQSFLLTCSSNRKHTDSDPETVSVLCNLLENYPLALEYARAYVNKTQTSYTEYMEIYQENKHDILKGAISKYKKTAYTAWKMSYDKIIQQSASSKDILDILSFCDSHDIPLKDIFVSSHQYSLNSLNAVILSIKNYTLLTTHDDFADIHGITQEFIRLQMQEDHEYHTQYKKTLQIFSEIMPNQITNASDKEIVDRIIKHGLQLISYNCDINDIDTLKFASNIASKLYILGYYNQTIQFVQKQLELHKSSALNLDLLQMVIFIAQAYHYIGEDNNALNIIEKYYFIVSPSEELTDSQKWPILSRYKNVEGIIQKDQGKFSLCLETFFEALDFVNKLYPKSDDDILSNILNNIGIAYRHLEQYESALEYYNKALVYSQNNKHLLLRIYGNIATTYKLLNEFESAFNFFEKSMSYSIELGDKRNECTCLGNMGDCYTNLHQYENAIYYLNKSLQIANEINFIIGNISAYCNLGRLFFVQQDFTKAEEYWRSALEKSHAINYTPVIDYINNALNQLPKGNGQ